ncbi:MAG: hypothetical protein AWU56_2174 [Idiomarina sp. T82-3]|nr:MAG: hypothetical protein AWU56_2174 [Idiomarina sp. T82-3]
MTLILVHVAIIALITLICIKIKVWVGADAYHLNSILYLFLLDNQ